MRCKLLIFFHIFFRILPQNPKHETTNRFTGKNRVIVHISGTLSKCCCAVFFVRVVWWQGLSQHVVELIPSKTKQIRKSGSVIKVTYITIFFPRFWLSKRFNTCNFYECTEYTNSRCQMHEFTISVTQIHILTTYNSQRIHNVTHIWKQKRKT